jgi:uncharacterized RDD family membrane protein YckC
MAIAASLGMARGRGKAGNRRELVTPEGVPLHLNLAQRGERVAAILIDLIIIIALIVVPILLIAFVSVEFSMMGWGWALILLVSFSVRSFYFVFFELRWNGTTPGKRAVGLRVVDRRGGRLTSEAIFARNLMREVELFIPLTLLLAPGEAGSEAWFTLLTLAWTSIFLLMPFFNRDRMRVGDIVAGTWVISAPKSVLLPDMAKGGNAISRPLGQATPDYQFTTEQLDAYGIYELQKLEDVLRDTKTGARATRDEVCTRIQRKIGWNSEDRIDSRRFLEEFYAALRAHLETKMLFGKRRRDKYDRS